MVAILGPDGQPLAPQRRRGISDSGRPRPQALNGGGNAPYDAADVYSAQMAAWRPYLWSPDGELNMYRDRIVARARDAERNDGWARGGIAKSSTTSSARISGR